MSEAPRTLAVIPARGGSKRLPRKNVLPLLGHPLISYTIRAAQKATRLTDWLVSSEDKEILDIARRYGAPVPFVRPAGLASDHIRNVDVLIHALHFMEEQRGEQYDIIMLLHPTTPIRDSEHIDQAIEMLWDSDCSTVAAVKGPYQKPHPILKRIDEEGILRPYREQEGTDEREPFYIYNAALYAAKRDYLLEERKFISSRQVPLVMDEFHSADVDNEADLLVVEAFLRYLQGKD